MAFWPSSVATDADLYVAVNALQTTLASTITNSATTISLANTTNFPTAGGVTIDQEVVFYTGISGSDLTGCTRGADGTSAAPHTAGVPVSHTIIAWHHNGLMYEIEAIESWLTTNVVANPAIGDIAMAGYTLTGLGAGTTAGESVRYEQLFGAFLPLSGGTLTGVLLLPNGSAAAPAMSYANDPNTGWFGAANDAMYFSSGGTQRGYFQGDNIFWASGSGTYPAYSFSGDNTSGLRYITAAGPAMVVGSNDVMQWTASAIQALQPIAMNSKKITGLANGTGGADAVALNQVKVLQIIYNSGTTNTAISAGTFSATAATATITPSTTASKVLIIATMVINSPTAATAGGRTTICRGSTNLMDTSGGGQIYSVAGALITSVTTIWVDSPATTSATTYNLYGLADGTGAVNFGNGRTWTMQLFEIQAA
jgi:hypothetical protein